MRLKNAIEALEACKKSMPGYGHGPRCKCPPCVTIREYESQVDLCEKERQLAIDCCTGAIELFSKRTHWHTLDKARQRARLITLLRRWETTWLRVQLADVETLNRMREFLG